MNQQPSESEPFSSKNDVTLWIKSVESGSDDSATQLWNYCFPRLLRHCRRKLPEHLRRALDEEDVALSAFKSFCLGAEGGAFPQLESRKDLWKLLICIAGRKAQAHVRHESRKKRGGGKVRGESIFSKLDPDSAQVNGIGEVAGNTASPDLLAQFTDDAQRMIDLLKTDQVKTVALLRLEGYSVDEIAERLGCGKRTIERRLNLIRRTWQEMLDDQTTSPRPPQDPPRPDQ